LKFLIHELLPRYIHTEKLRSVVVVMAVKGLAIMRPQGTRVKINSFVVPAPALAGTIIEVH
jgi:hypothetical protein